MQQATPWWGADPTINLVPGSGCAPTELISLLTSLSFLLVIYVHDSQKPDESLAYSLMLRSAITPHFLLPFDVSKLVAHSFVI